LFAALRGWKLASVSTRLAIFVDALSQLARFLPGPRAVTAPSRRRGFLPAQAGCPTGAGRGSPPGRPLSVTGRLRSGGLVATDVGCGRRGENSGPLADTVRESLFPK